MAKNYKKLHEQIAARPGAAERLAELRAETLAEIGLYELRKQTGHSQMELAAALGISQSAVSQLESGDRGDDVKLSTLRNYVQGLGAQLKITAVFDNDGEEIAVPVNLEPIK